MAAAKEKKMSRTERNEEDRTNVGKERELKGD
jgi:hypothetical protein